MKKLLRIGGLTPVFVFLGLMLTKSTSFALTHDQHGHTDVIAYAYHICVCYENHQHGAGQVVDYWAYPWY